MDKPNERSAHSIPVVRGGGMVVIALPMLALPFLCYFYNASLSTLAVFVISVLLLACISFMDDLHTLQVKPRLMVQVLVSLLIALFIVPQGLDFIFFTMKYKILIIPVVFFLVLWSINHFNFMDGIDGFCSLQAAFLLASYAVLFYFNHADLYVSFCLFFVASLLGFLVYNFPPAKIFLGDVGSATLGLVVFCVALIGQQRYQIPILFWFMLNALFLFDATVTLLRRMYRKEDWTAAHNKHAYQRLKRSGINTKWILYGQFLINVLFLNLVLLLYAGRLNVLVALLFQLVFLSTLYYFIEKRAPMH